MKQRLAASALFALLASQPLHAQNVNPVTPLVAGAPVSGSNPMPISGSFSASLSGFTPSTSGARGTPLSVTTSDSSGALPTGTVDIVNNVGSNPMYCNVNGVTSTTSDQLIPASSWFAFTIPSGVTTLHCIATGGSTTANTLGGSGLPTGAGGGGSGGGGGGGAITMASGAVASGAYSAGSIAAGALVAGALVDGADVTQGTKADAAYSGSGSASAIAILKGIYSSVNGSIPAGTATIGNVGSDPSSGKGTPSSVAINVSTAATTQLVALSGSTAIYVTSFDFMAGGTGNVTLEYGTGSSCGTGTTALTGAYPLTAQNGIAKGNGLGTVLKVPSGNALCILTSAAVQVSGSVSFQQF